MNSYYFGLNGSLLILVLLIIISIAISALTYRFTVPPITNKKKALLITLRSLALTLLLFFLFEPVLSIIKGDEVKPKILILLDNSASMGMSDAGGDRKEKYKLALKNLGLENFDSKFIDYLLFDSEIKQHKEFTIDSLNFKGQMTDISRPLQWSKNYKENENLSAILLITDGAFNIGKNPLFDAEFLGKPIFTVGIGDTSEPKDVLIQSIVTNEIVYIANPVPVNVNVKVNGYTQGELTLYLKENGVKFAEQKISINPEQENYTAIFEYLPKTDGIKKITAEINALENEITLKNNSISEFITVLKNKRKILILAGSPSPDLSFLRNSFNNEKGIELKIYAQKAGAEFYEGNPTQTDFNESEIIILIGFPKATSSANIMQQVKNELERGKSLLFIASQDIDYEKLKIIQNFVPFNIISTKPNEFLALPLFQSEAMANPILRITGSNLDLEMWNRLPPIFRTETFVRVKPEAEVLARFKVNNVLLKEPLIIQNEFQGVKSIFILGYGLYRWKLLGYASEIAKGRTETKDLYEIFIHNTFKWLSVTKENKNIIVKTTKKIYSGSENIEFIGQIYDASYNIIDDATIVVKMQGSDQPQELTLRPTGNGRYNGSIAGLKEGDYAWKADVSLNGKLLGSEQGRFTVGELSLEFQKLNMNKALLDKIAESTGGKFYLPNETGNFINDLNNLSSYKSKSITTRTELVLWQLPYFLVLAILAFSLEWFLRKRLGLL